MKRMIEKIRARVRRAVENYRGEHVPARCLTGGGGCDCPCGWCHHSRLHVAGAR